MDDRKPPSDPLRDLQARADALEKRTAAPRAPTAISGSRAADQGYRIVADLFGGVLVGLALGFGVDRLTGHPPAGLIGGILLGFAVSVWMAKKTADRLMAQSARETSTPAPSIPFDDADDD